jgi:hypothetical protein
VVVPIGIATLGPEGTDSENAAKRIINLRNLEGGVILCDSFEIAKQKSIQDNHYFLIPAAYSSRDSNVITDTWGDFNFREMGKLELLDALVLPLKEMCVARNDLCINPISVSLHPSTEVFAQRYANNFKRDYIHSKPLAVKRCSEGLSDLCIGSSDVIERYDNLIIQERFQPNMVWTLYARR